MKKKLHYATGFALALSSSLSAQTFTDTIRVDYSGSSASVNIPACITGPIKFILAGASGANGGGPAGGTGGKGAIVEQIVQPGEYQPGLALTVYVGGAASMDVGGFNGGGNGVNSSGGFSGGGGGATDVRVGSTLADRVIVAAGGGGGGVTGCDPDTQAGNGGDGGSDGSNGGDTPTPSGPNPVGVAGGGFGGAGSTGGAPGIGCSGFLGTAGTNGVLGVGGNGGNGQTCCCFSTGRHPHGGGGGGGNMGGGAGGGGSAGTAGCSGNDKGAGGGGAGGTNLLYAGATVAPVVTTDTVSGDGYFMLIYNRNIDIAVTVDPTYCLGEDAVLSATSIADASYSWDTPNADTTADVTISSPAAGTYTYTVSVMKDVCQGTATATFTVQDCAGINEAAVAAFNCYPNPAVNNFTVNAKTNEMIASVEVFDASGKVVYAEKDMNAEKVLITTSEWKKGNYTVRVNGNYTQAIIKQ